MNIDNAKKITNVVKYMHEASNPFYTSEERKKYNIEESYGGMTGTVRMSDYIKVVDVLLKDSIENLFSRNEVLSGTFCDIGSGTGIPVIYIASCDYRLEKVIGFDIDQIQIENANNRLKRCISKNIPIKTNISFHQLNILQLNEFNVDYIYTFMADSNVIKHIIKTSLQLNSKVKKIAFVLLRCNDLYSTNFINDNDEDVVIIKNLKTSGGTSCTGYIIPITDERRSRSLK